MSPRSDELLASAREWLSIAEAALKTGFPAGAAAEAYYAIAYAARAALSEDDRNAKTHRGIWSLFAELYVKTGRFDASVYQAARSAEERRRDVHYEGVLPSEGEGRKAVEDARRFIEAIEKLLAA